MRALYLLLILITTGSVYAQQSIAYYYDDAGNRIKREQCACVGNKPDKPNPTEVNTLTANILPNPTQGKLTIEATEKNIDLSHEATHFHVLVYDIAGRELLNEQHYSATFSIDITRQPAGVYFVKLFTEKKMTQWEVVKR